MEMSRQQHVKRNVIWGIFNKSLILILSFVIRSVLIFYMGIEYAGLSSLFTSVLKMLNVAELGFGNAIVYSMYKPVAENDASQINALLCLYRKCYYLIGIFIGIVGVLLIPALPYLIRDGQSVANINLTILYLMYLINTISSYLFLSYRRSILIAHQETAIESNVLSAISIVQYIFQIFVIVYFRNYYFYTILLPVGTIIFNLICGQISIKRYKQYHPKGKISKSEINEIIKMIKGMLLQKIGGVVLTGADNIVISVFVGVRILGIYNNYYYIILGLYEIFTVIMNGMKASVGNSMITEDVENNYAVFKLLNFLYVWLTTFVSIAFLCLAQPFVSIWLGTEYLLPDYLLVLFTIYFFMNKWSDMLYVYQEAAGLWWENRFIPFSAAVVNVVINIILVQIVGLAGILLSTILSLIIYTLGYAYVLFKYYFHNYKWLWAYLGNQVVLLTGILIAAPLAYFICSFINVGGIYELIYKAIVCVFIPNIIFIVVFCWKKEFWQAFNLLKNFIGSIKK